jgi:hypothetical protein
MAVRRVLEERVPDTGFAASLFSNLTARAWLPEYEHLLAGAPFPDGVIPIGGSASLTLELVRGTIIRGCVQRRRGGPFEGARVCVTRQSVTRLDHWSYDIPNRFTAYTGPEGLFQVPVWPEGIVHLRVESDGSTASRHRVDLAAPRDVNATLDDDPLAVATQRRIERVAEFIDRVEMDTNAHPPSGNASLVEVLKQHRFAFERGDLDDASRLIDAWGRPFIYKNWAVLWPRCQTDPTANNTTSYDLYSAAGRRSRQLRSRRRRG